MSKTAAKSWEIVRNPQRPFYNRYAAIVHVSKALRHPATKPLFFPLLCKKKKETEILLFPRSVALVFLRTVFGRGNLPKMASCFPGIGINKNVYGLIAEFSAIFGGYGAIFPQSDITWKKMKRATNRAKLVVVLRKNLGVKCPPSKSSLHFGC